MRWPSAEALRAPVGDCCVWEVEICPLLWAGRVVRLLFGVSQGASCYGSRRLKPTCCIPERVRDLY